MDILKTVLLSMFGTVFGGLVGFLLGIVMERHKQTVAKIIDEKLNVIPVIDSFINRTKHYPAPNIVRQESLQALAPKYLRLKVIATGGDLKRINEAWETLCNTTEKEMCDGSGTGVFDVHDSKQRKELESIQQILIGRLEAFKDAVERL